MKTRKEHEAEIRWAQYLEGNACRMDDATLGKRIKIARRACLPVQGAGGNRCEAMKTAKQVIQRIKTIAGGVHFDREEAAKLRELAEYCMRGFMGPHHATIMMIRAKVQR